MRTELVAARGMGVIGNGESRRECGIEHPVRWHRSGSADREVSAAVPWIPLGQMAHCRFAPCRMSRQAGTAGWSEDIPLLAPGYLNRAQSRGAYLTGTGRSRPS